MDFQELRRNVEEAATKAVQTAIPYVVAGANAVSKAAGNLKQEQSTMSNDVLNLVKGGQINLTKATGGQTKFTVRLSWGQGADLDVSAIPLNADNKIVMPIVYYGNLQIPGITHSGDLRDGGAEEIVIETNEIKTDRILIAVTSHSQKADGGRDKPVLFGASASPKAELKDEKGNVLVVVDLASDAALSTAIEFVELSKSTDGSWVYKNLTNPLGKDAFGLAEVSNKYPQA